MTLTTGETPAAVPGHRRVRRAVWTALAAALLCAFAMPALTLWHASRAALAAHACIQLADPRFGQPAHIVVTLPEGADRGAVAGPGGAVVADWDMVTMSMGARRAVAPGVAARHGVVVLPVQLDMAGIWRINVALRAPGRPDWRSTLDVQVPAAPTPTAAATMSLASCGGH